MIRENFISIFSPTSFAELPSKRVEAQNVADMFGTTANGQVDWEEFLIALNPEWANEPQCIADAVHEEVRRLVMMCTCRQKFRVFQVGEGKYRVRRSGADGGAV